MKWRESSAIGGFALIVVIDETNTIAKLAVNQHTCTCDLRQCSRSQVN